MNEVLVELDNVFVIQRNLKQILSNVSFKLHKAEFAYIIGRTGTGKSSLLKTLYADLDLHEGEGSVLGYNLRSIKKVQIPNLRRRIGMVFQDFNLLPDRNVEENLLFVLKATGWKTPQAKVRMLEVLDSVDLKEIRLKRPHQLSGGEQQRVVIARALLNKPDLILADEPTGNLDPDVSDEILELLHKIAQEGTAVLMATHDYRVINKYPGTVYKIDDGTVDRTTLFG
jgi:cell division transport system ATP-binding protein